MSRPTTSAEPVAESGSVQEREPYRVLGLDVHPYNVDQWNNVLVDRVRSGGQHLVVSQNLHAAAMLNREPAMREIRRDALAHIDGTPLVWVGRYLLGYPLATEHRVTWLDWVHPLCDTAIRQQWRVFYLGSRPEVINDAAEILKKQHPELDLHTHHGHFDMTPGHPENERVVEQINAVRPHLLLVGMGMGRQERWVCRERHRLETNVILTCGALMDYIGGAVPTPPRWMGPVGLEWTHRLLADPRRLAHRYLVEPWRLLPRLTAEVWHRRVRGGR